MSDVVIRVENLSKHYRLGQISGGTLREDLQSWWAGVRGKEDPLLEVGAKPRAGSGEHWALKEVSFDVRQGEVLGIIGRNGAGKSTLLKILSRTTAPTTGSVCIKGRIASLLEVGTGFHPELSGRENIYLNGAILGMKKAEIDRKLDEIIDFSGIDVFIDTPVKRYSSGMYVRLAFSVAAHLEPEILVVDEVLAVGDMAFQKKCLGKLDSVSKDGRTVLFVSHNMATLSNLCKTGLFMHEGSLDFQGGVSEAIIRYYKDTNRSENKSLAEFRSDVAELMGFELIGLSGLSDVSVHDELVVRMEYKINKQLPARCVPNFHFFSSDGSYVFVSNAPEVGEMRPGCYQADCTIPADFLNEGAYFVGVALTTHLDAGTYNVEFYNQNAMSFNVIDPMEERSNRYSYSGPMPGVIRPRLAWSLKETFMKAVILAGGLGTRISEETHLKPKPMIEIGGMPILWHILKLYSAHGVNEFVICCGYKGYVIKEYFANYFLHMSDVTFDMANNRMEVHHQKAEPWKVTLVDTGDDTLTGGRLKRVADYIGNEEAFCFTYGDGVSDVDIGASIQFHRQHGKLATVTAVQPPGRYGALERAGDQVTGFVEKPRGDGGLINGGFFVLSPKCLALIEGDQTSWEGEPLFRLAKMNEMMAFAHHGFWQPMDTLRDKNLLEELWVSGRAPWKIW